jgi:hypothetical protein
MGMKNHLKEAFCEVVNKKRIPDLIVLVFIIGFILMAVFRGTLGETETLLILTGSTAVIMAMTMLIAIVLLAIVKKK